MPKMTIKTILDAIMKAGYQAGEILVLSVILFGVLLLWLLFEHGKWALSVWEEDPDGVWR
jgi:hypothetical protein